MQTYFLAQLSQHLPSLKKGSDIALPPDCFNHFTLLAVVVNLPGIILLDRESLYPAAAHSTILVEYGHRFSVLFSDYLLYICILQHFHTSIDNEIMPIQNKNSIIAPNVIVSSVFLSLYPIRTASTIKNIPTTPGWSEIKFDNKIVGSVIQSLFPCSHLPF